jgi:hypothetical protein
MHDTAIRYYRHLQEIYHSALARLVQLPYVKTDFSRWTWESDVSDDAEEDCSTDIIDMNMDSSSAGTKSGVLLKQVFPLQIDFTVYAFANENKRQINAQS